jgi:hypothetical protein
MQVIIIDKLHEIEQIVREAFIIHELSQIVFLIADFKFFDFGGESKKKKTYSKINSINFF